MLREPPGRASSVIFLQIWFWAYVIVVAVGQGSKSSHVAYNRSSIPNPFRDDEPACDLQVYSFASWHAENGDELPDHPAIFEPDPGTSFPALKMFPSFESVLLKMGQDKVNSEPGYAQAGGHLEIVWPGSKVGWKGSLAELSSSWNSSHRGWYHSEFNCQSSLCRKLKPFMAPAVPFGRGLNVHRINFLVGGPGSGLPFHRHSATWQTLVNGRKAWFLVPPDRMGPELSSVVGPLLYAPDAWDARMRGQPLGVRPLRCVQYPGEYLWVPHMWWHATKNLDANVAYGQRPAYTSREVQKKVAAEQHSAAGGSNTAFDSEGGIPLQPWPPEVPASTVGAALVKPFALDPLQPTLGGRGQWFDILGLQTWAANRSLSDAAAAYNEVLAKVRSAVKGALPEDADVMRETASFMHCHLAAQLGRVAADKKTINPPGTLDATTAAATAPLLADWAAIARNYSASMFAQQCQRSGGSGHWVAPMRNRSRRRQLREKPAHTHS